MFNKDFSTLYSAFKAILNRETKDFSIPLKFIKNDIRIVSFINNADFIKNKDKIELTNSELFESAQTLSKLSPNTIYPQKAFVATDSSVFNIFKSGKSVNEKTANVFNENFSLNKKKTIKTAEAYRINYSRLWISIIRTLNKNGCKINFTNSTSPQIGDYPLTIYKGEIQNTPIKKSLLIPFENCAIWIYNRCNNFYVCIENIIENQKINEIINNTIEGYNFNINTLTKCSEVNISDNEMPIITFAMLIKDLKLSTKQIDIKLDGSDFEFIPSAADMIGYADMKFDEVKRMDINVDSFKNAVYDFGTYIDEIINETYDLFPVYHNGQKAFDNAVINRLKRELEIN
ncbi:MAG: hypothetical protein MJ211_14145 [Bacteroidales bacterium]|nr:hypothetical protein [Bacteroidales bacterium]